MIHQGYNTKLDESTLHVENMEPSCFSTYSWCPEYTSVGLAHDFDHHSKLSKLRSSTHMEQGMRRFARSVIHRHIGLLLLCFPVREE